MARAFVQSSTAPSPAAQRLTCPLCPWFHDEPEPDPFVGFDQPIEWPAGARTIDEAVRAISLRRHDRIEAAARAHFADARPAELADYEQGRASDPDYRPSWAIPLHPAG